MARSRTMAVSAALLLGVAPLAAQDTQPAGWRWLLDGEALRTDAVDEIPAGTFGFRNMAPGWHITMGPGGALYDSAQIAAGRFTLTSRLILFGGDSPEEYGVFLGGRNLEGADASWVAFVVRRDGSAAVLRRASGGTTAVVPWTRHEAVRAHPGGSATVTNVVRVTADSAVVFAVNDVVVASLPRATVADGGFGFRVGRGVNLHITTLDLTRMYAPARR